MNFSTILVLVITHLTLLVSASESDLVQQELNKLSPVLLQNQALGQQAAPIKAQIKQLQNALYAIETQYVKIPTVSVEQDIKRFIESLSTEKCQLKIVNQKLISLNIEKTLPHMVLTKVTKQAGQTTTEWLAVPLEKGEEPLILESNDMYSLNSGYTIHYRKGKMAITFTIEVRGNKSMITANAKDEDHNWKTLTCEN